MSSDKSIVRKEADRMWSLCPTPCIMKEEQVIIKYVRLKEIRPVGIP